MKKSIITYVVVVALIALLAVTAAFGLDLGFTKLPSVEDGVTLGLDLVGGSEITYEAVIPDGTDASDISDGISSAVTMLRQRLDSLGYSEATVTKQGDDQIVVDIPAVSNPEEAASQIGTTAVVEFRTADYDEEAGTGMVITGSAIESARAEYSAVDSTGTQQWHVVLEFNSEGQSQFAEITKYAANMDSDNNWVGIYLDDTLISSPQVSTDYASTGIDSDSAIITLGSSTDSEYATYLANIIAAGQLPFTLENVKMESVGASLGEESLSTSLMAGAIGIVLVILFMIIFYRLPGLIAGLALTLYTALFLVVISIAKLNLSLPGIAGIILTIGMAVDANVIIFERIKEEIANGKTVRASIDSGYRNAMSAIIDSNVTTIIASVVLWKLGTGSTVGFAKTLFIGVILSMLVMLFASRFMMKALVGLKATNPALYGVKLQKEEN
jgi:protein-export membrane protein SecD